MAELIVWTNLSHLACAHALKKLFNQLMVALQPLEGMAAKLIGDERGGHAATQGAVRQILFRSRRDTRCDVPR